MNHESENDRDDDRWPPGAGCLLACVLGALLWMIIIAAICGIWRLFAEG